MKIASIETVPLQIPFNHGGDPGGWGGQAWSKLNVLLLRVETEQGHVGWGDAFSYNCLGAVRSIVDDMIAPIAVGQDAGDIAGMMNRLQRELHLFGRYGMTMFALSGLDIALWDIAGKAAGMPLHKLLGGAGRTRIPGYASLFRYGRTDVVAEQTERALAQGYRIIKLHETAEAEVAAAREAAGHDVPITIDTNCPWSRQQAREAIDSFLPYDPYWVEEPVWPPEDFASLAALQEEFGLPMAAGENACTAFEFQKMFDAGAVTFAQPSVSKVGGVSEFRKICTLAELRGVTIMPHAPYFGPGFLATLQLLASAAPHGWIERLFVDVEASLYGETINPDADGDFSVPDGPGLGREPNPDVIRDYRI